MAGKQAKLLSRQQVAAALRHVRRSRYPQRDRVIILLSVKAGLRAGEIAKLTWPMLLDPEARIADRIKLHDTAAKNEEIAQYRAASNEPPCRRADCQRGAGPHVSAADYCFARDQVGHCRSGVRKRPLRWLSGPTVPVAPVSHNVHVPDDPRSAW
jgi:hypothetical protein